MNATETVASLPKVHISHCDADAGLAKRLIEGLQATHRFEVTTLTDKKPLKRNWKSHSARLIAQADAVLFVLSARTMESKVLAWQLEKATEMSKRIIPIRSGPLHIKAIPEPLASIRAHHFDKRRPFQTSLGQLLHVLSINADWVQKHTQLYVRACVWNETGRPEESLLTSAEIVDAKNWTFERPNDAPKPTKLHLEFIQASEHARTVLQTADFKGSAFIQAEHKRAKSGPNVAEASNSTVALRAPAGLARIPSAQQAEQKGQPKLGGADETLPIPVKDGQNRNPLQVVLGSSLVILTGVAVWQALSEARRPLEPRNQVVVQSQTRSDITQSIFRTQIDQLERAIDTIDCMFLDSAKEEADCMQSIATPLAQAQVTGAGDFDQ